MTLKIYNTQSRMVEEFSPLHGKRVNMFVCGPTVYDRSHIGHARTYLAYDIIARYLRAKGYSVFYLMNITDVEDKIISKANNLGQDPLVLADKFTKDFLQDMKSLGIESINLYAKASEHISEIIAQISVLVDKGFAYQVEGDVFYDVSHFSDYGKLSHQNIDQLAMHRIDPDPRKRNVVDFALWKSQKPGEPAWDSPWGRGRPGWHIEDTAITTTYFGASYDLHGGGLDLIFPHHEAEIAQAEAATGRKPLVKYWIHGGLLTVAGSRMGKSMGNFVTIKEALLTHEAESLRLYFAMSHYRSQLEYSESGILQAEQVLERLRSVYDQFRRPINESKTANAPPETVVEISKITSAARRNFDAAMDDDFNTPRALAAIITYTKEISPYAGTELNKETVAEIVGTFDYFGAVFGILEPRVPVLDSSFEKVLRLLLKIRDEARKGGDWKTSDTIRRSLNDAGVIVEDTATGSKWHLKPVSESC